MAALNSQRLPEAVLAILAVCADLGCTRDRLVALLWPDSDGAVRRVAQAAGHERCWAAASDCGDITAACYLPDEEIGGPPRVGHGALKFIAPCP